MISLEITGCCYNCPYIEQTTAFYYAGAQKVYLIKCVHEDVCGNLREEQEG